MRIIGGKHKGRHIPIRKNFPARPTTDFAKENIFNVLHNYFNFSEISVLDLFGGTGSISFEFASRGCEKITVVEKDYRSCEFIKKTAIELKMDQIKAIKSDVFRFIEKCNIQFDIVFADPPFDLNTIHEIPELILNTEIIKPEGWLILEHGKQNNFKNNPLLIDLRAYGSVHFSIFQKN